MTCTVCKAKFKLLTVVETINDIPSMSSCSKIPMASWYVCKKCGKGFNKYTLEQCPYCHTPVEK
jgi:rubrerythrin